MEIVLLCLWQRQRSGATRRHGQNRDRLDQRISDLLRVAAGDTRRRRRFRPGISHCGSRLDRCNPGGDCARHLSPAKTRTPRYRAPDHHGFRRRHRLSAAHRIGAAAHNVRPFDRVHRAPAACNRDLRRAEGRRAAEAGLLAVLHDGQRAGDGLRSGARNHGGADRRHTHAGGGHRLRARLCRGCQAVAAARAAGR
jgi:hypothetical protein